MNTNATANVAIAIKRAERAIAPEIWDSVMSRAAATNQDGLAHMVETLTNGIDQGWFHNAAAEMYTALLAELRGMYVARFGLSL